MGELLRRLPVISLEDSITHPALPLVVWLMASQSKGYQLGVVHAAAVLQFVYEMSAVKVCMWRGTITVCHYPGVAHG